MFEAVIEVNARRLIPGQQRAFRRVIGQLLRMEEKKLDSEAVQQSLEDDRDDTARSSAFHETVMTVLRHDVSGPLVAPYERFGQAGSSWYGLARYWRKQQDHLKTTEHG